MRLVLLSDTHNQHERLVMPPGDILVHAGDATVRGRPQEVIKFLDWFEAQPYRYKIFIAGNHDFLFEQDPYLAQAFTVQRNMIYLLDDAIELEGVNFYGSPWQPEFCNWAFNLPRGDALKRKWAKIPDNTDVLITHGPPAGILDMVAAGEHVGCEDLLHRVREIAPKIHVFGHIHEAYGLYREGKTLFVNAANCDLKYNPINSPYVVELTDSYHRIAEPL